MSRPIAESLSLLSETLGNCKTNLKEKEVADVDNIKISDVDEKIAEIQAGGGESSRNLKVTINKIEGFSQIDGSPKLLANSPVEVSEFYKLSIWESGLKQIKFYLTIDCDPKYLYLDVYANRDDTVETTGSLNQGHGDITVTVKNENGFKFKNFITEMFFALYCSEQRFNDMVTFSVFTTFNNN